MHVKNLERSMSLKINFLASHLNFLAENMGIVSGEYTVGTVKPGYFC